MRRLWIRILAVAAAVLLMVVAAVALLHTPWASERLLRVGLDRLAPDGSIQVASLEYSLFTRRITLHGVAMSSPGHPLPYFAADEITVRLPWRALRGELALDEVILRRPRFTVHVDQDGRSNFEGDSGGLPGPVPIERLELDGLEIEFDDARSAVAFRAAVVRVVITAAADTSMLQQPQAASLRVGERDLSLRVADGTVGWDGSRVLLRRLGLVSEPGSLTVDGAVDALDGQLRLDVQTDIDLGEVARLEGSGAPLSGSVSATGTVEGGSGGISAAFDVSAPMLRWDQLQLASVRGQVSIGDTIQLRGVSALLAGGSVSLEAEVPLADGDTVVTARWSGVDLEQLATDSGLATAVPAGTLADGQLQASWPGTTAAMDTVRARIELRMLTAPAGGGADFALDATLRDGRVTGNFTASTADLGGLAVVAGGPAGLAGRGRLEGALGGSVDAISATGRLSLEDLRWDDSGPLTVDTGWDAAATSLQLGGLEIAAEGVALRGDLEVDIAAPSIRGEAALDAVSASAILAALPSAFRAELPPGALPGGIEASIRLSPAPIGTRVDRFELRTAGGEIRASGVLSHDLSRFEGIADIVVTDAAGLTGMETLADLRGATAELGVAVDTQRGATVLDLWSLQAELPAGDVLVDVPARITVDADGWTVEDLLLQAGPARVAVAGHLPYTGDGDLRATATGDLASLADLIALYWEQSGRELPVPRVAGLVEIDLRVAGTVTEPRPFGDLQLRGGSIAIEGVGEIPSIDVLASVDGDAVHVRQLTAAIPGGRVRLTATLPLAHVLDPGAAGIPPISIEADLVADDPELLRPWLAEDQLQALAVRAHLRASATAVTLAAVDAELRIEELVVHAGDVGLGLSSPSLLRLRDSRLSLQETRVGLVAGSTQREITLTGELGIDADDPWSSAVTLHAAGSLDLRDLQPWLPAGYLATGVTSLEVEVAGTLAELAPRGHVRVEGGSIAVAEPRMRLSDLNGTIDIDGTTLHTDGISGRANGGDLMLFLDLDLADPLLPVGIAGLTARNVAVEAAGLRAGADADLTLSARGAEELRLFGTITIAEGGYRSNRPLGRELLGALGAAAAPVAAAAEGGGLLDRLTYDIRVRTAEDIVVDTSYAELAVAADLHVVGSGSRPGVVGELVLGEGGQVFLVGNTYSVDRGAIALTDPSRIVPSLDIQTSTRISQWDVFLNVTGDAFAPSVAVRSYPSLSEADIYSLMTTGRTLADAREAGSQILAEQAWGVLTGQLQGAARSLGFSSIRFEQAQDAHNWRSLGEPDLFPKTTDLAARLTITRPIGSRFELTYSQSLTQTKDQSWIGSLRLPWDIQLRAGTYDDGSNVVEARHRLIFGAPPRESGSRTVRPLVTAVRFSGAPGLSEDLLLGELRVRTGKRFDFVQWRRDIDRLGELYAREGYLDARIRAVRHGAGDGVPVAGSTSLELEYDIDRGPRTQLTVEGYTFSDKLLREMQRTWQQSVATDFLLDDLRGIALRALADQGHVIARVDTTLAVDDAERQEIVVRVEPGPEYRRLEIDVQGAQAVPADELRVRLAQAGLERAVWYDPAAVTREVLGTYRLAGYPDARARIGEPRFADGRAIATIQVEEGEADSLVALTLHGANAIEPERLRGLVALQPGEPATPAAIAAATESIADEYLRHGYNRATISTRLQPHADGTELIVEIVEGRQQIIDAIDVAGRRRTRQSVIDKAIKVRVGEPLQLSQLEQSRRALMATEALQSAAASITPAESADPGVERVRVTFTIEEKPLAELRYGVQVLSELQGVSTLEDERTTRPGISAILSHGNFLGVGATASLMGSYRDNEPFARASVSFPRFFGLPIRTLLLAQRYSTLLSESDAFSVRQTVARGLLEQRLDRGPFKFGYSYTWEQSRNEIIDPTFPIELDPVTVTKLVPTFVWDTRDDRFEPRRGWFHASTYDLALQGLGSELQFHKYYGQQYAFFPVGPVVLASGIRFGAGQSFDEASDKLPLQELFVVGGATTVRGYPDDSLGRTEFFGAFFPGGDVALILNQEVRFPIYWWFRGVVFADAGYAFNSLDEVSLANLKYSTGAGLRLVTPYLTLRLDYGLRLSDIDYLPDLPRGRFTFGIGHIF